MLSRYLTYLPACLEVPCAPSSPSLRPPRTGTGTELNLAEPSLSIIISLAQPSPAALPSGAAAATHEPHREWILQYPQLCTQRDSSAPQLQHTQSESMLAARRIQTGYRARPAVASRHGAHTYRSRDTARRSHETHVHFGSGAAPSRPGGCSSGRGVAVVVVVV